MRRRLESIRIRLSDKARRGRTRTGRWPTTISSPTRSCGAHGCASGAQLSGDVDADRRDRPRADRGDQRQYEARGEVVRFRSKAEVEAFFQGLELVEPGIVQVNKWRPDPDEVSAVSDREVNMYGGLARKPGVRGGGRST